MQGKIETKEQDDEDSQYDDLFIAEGLSLSSSKSDGLSTFTNANASQIHTHAAKQKHKKLECVMFCAKENRQHERVAAEEKM